MKSKDLVFKIMLEFNFSIMKYIILVLSFAPIICFAQNRISNDTLYLIITSL